MQQMLATSGNYKKSNSTLINQLVAFADGEFEASTGSSVGKIARASEILRSKRASLVIPETPACSQNVSGQDVPAKTTDNEDPDALASEPAATAPAAQNTTDTPDNGATPTPQPEFGATVTPQVDEHVKTQ